MPAGELNLSALADPAEDAPQPDPETREKIRVLAESLLQGELARPLASARLSVSDVADEATDDGAAEILAEVAGEWRDVILSQRRYLHASRGRRLQRIAILLTAFALLPVLVGSLLGASGAWKSLPAGVSLALLAASIVFVRRGSRAFREQGSADSAATLLEVSDAAEAKYDQALRRAVRGWLTAAINRSLEQLYGVTLPELNPEGLAEIDGLDREVPTAARVDLGKRLERMPGGSIGIAGPRGAGKTTLIRQMTGAGSSRYAVVGVVVDAPVEYDAREFVLHVFAKLCETVLGPDRVAELRGWKLSWRPRPGGRIVWGSLPYPPVLGPIVTLIGLFALVAIAHSEGNIKAADLRPWAIALTAAGGLLTYVSLISGRSAAIDFVRSLVRRQAEPGNPVATAELRLQQIWFQQSFSSGWSGALKLPLGVQAGAEKSRQLAENQLSFPDVVGLYREFVGLLTARGQVRVGIDELDKMDDQTARRFLNEIKVIFRASDCFYLVSVSEDAMSYFERRGLSFRDVFDSSFDEIIRVGYLDFDAIQGLLRKRVVGMPVQFAGICHILGGGLPRDVIRVARELNEQPTNTSLGNVAAALFTTHLESKREAAEVAIRRLASPKRALLLSRWLRNLPDDPDVQAVLKRCMRFPVEFVAPLGAPPADDPGQTRDHEEVMGIALEVISFAYFGVTLVEFMQTLGTPEQGKRAAERGYFDDLAKARQAFSVNPGEAWEKISAFREGRLDPGPVDFPLANA